MSERWYKQTKLEKDLGNCVETAVACLLGLPIEQVPDFRVNGTDASNFWFAFEEYINRQGYEVHCMPHNYHPDSMYLASGLTVRDTRHMVIMQNGALLHDPHPDDTGLTVIECVRVLTPFDPSRFVLRDYPVTTPDV